MRGRLDLIVVSTLLFVGWTAHAAPWDTKSIVTQLSSRGGGKCDGEMTYYGAGQNSAGSCAYSKSNALSLPAASGNKFLNTGIYSNQAVYLAINSAQFDNSQTCGMCIRFQWKGTGAGRSGDNPPSGYTYAFIDNLCPECPPCNVDNAFSRDGRWKIKWEVVDCPVGSSPIWYQIDGSHEHYLKLQAYNTRVPVKMIEVFSAGAWRKGSRTVDNYFIMESGGVKFTNNMRVRVTSILDEVVEDSISMSWGRWYGKGNKDVQFQQGVGGAGAVAGQSNANRRVRPAARKPAVKKPAAKRKSAAKKPAGKAACKFKLYKGWQCGGKKGWCNKSTGCVDRPWKGGCCQGSRCVRKNSATWVCK